MKRILSVLCLSLVVLPTLSAQSRKETSLYEKVLQSRSASVCNRFLSRYPSSVYAQQVAALRDTLLYISPVSPEEAFEILTALRPDLRREDSKPQVLKAIGYRDEGVDYVLGLCLDPEQAPQDSLRLYGSKRVRDIWQPVFEWGYELYTLEMDGDRRSYLHGAPEAVTVEGERMLRASYRNVSSDGRSIEHVEALLAPLDSHSTSVMFYGKPLEGLPRRIEGQSPETLIAEEMRSPQVNYLLGVLSQNRSLVEIAPADALSDEAIAWWLANNPAAATSASKLTFGQLPEDCSIVSTFRQQNRETGAGYSAALFDIRGYTVVCASHHGEWMLVWCEPKCKDRSRDRYLNTIYFEKGATLCLYYYKGRTTFKYRINLASKSIVR